LWEHLWEMRKAILLTIIFTLVVSLFHLMPALYPQSAYADPDTETLRPNAAGDETSISSQYPVSGVHWDKVDEAIADDSATYVYTTSTSYQRDLYDIPAHTGSGTINSVTIYFRLANCAARTYAIAYTDLDSEGFLKTVEIATDGQITDTVIETLEFDTVLATTPNIIPISGDVYAVAYSGPGDDGFLKTVEISTNGNITDTVIDTLEFDISQGLDPNIIHVSGNVYAIAYKGKLDDGFLKTVEIATDGQITDTVIDTLEFDTVLATAPNIIPVSGNVYAIAYWGNAGDGFLRTVEIATNGQITDTVIDTLVFDAVMGFYPNIISVSGDVYAIAYEGIFGYGYLKTVEIATDGQITDTVIDTLEFDSIASLAPNIIPVSGNVYAIAYPGGSTDGFLKTVEIANNGNITDTVIDTLEFDTNDGKNPNIIPISGNVYAIAYKGVYVYYDGENWQLEHGGLLRTVEIATNGQITDTEIDALKFDAGNDVYPNIIPVAYTPGNVSARAAIKTHGTVYTGSEESTSSDTFVTKSYQWTQNPNTNSTWTWDEIDALQIGVDLKTGDASDSAACTQLYVEVDYSPTPPGLTVDSISIYQTDHSTVVTSMTPQTEYAVKVTVTDADTLADLATVEVTIFYDSDGDNDPLDVPGTGDTQNAAILTCTVGGTPSWQIDPSSGTTWVLVEANSVQPTLTETTGDFWFHFKSGKVATEALDWDVYAEADDGGGTPGTLYDSSGYDMNWYGEITGVSATVSFGAVTLGSSDTISTSAVSATYISNGPYDEQVKSDAAWVGQTTGTNLSLDTGGAPGSGEFSLKADDDNTLAGAVQVPSASYATIDDTGTITAEAGETQANNYLWLSLGSSGIPDEEYQGTIYYKIADGS